MIGKRIDAGNGSNNIIGNKNVLINISNVRAPKRSLIYDVSCSIAAAEIENTQSYLIATNSDWEEKIIYNKVEKYREIFDIHSSFYDVVEDALDGLSSSKREILIRNIKTLYCNFKNEARDENKDKILDLVFGSLLELIDESDSQANLLYEEDKRNALYSVMFYSFTKCQLLDVVPEMSDVYVDS